MNNPYFCKIYIFWAEFTFFLLPPVLTMMHFMLYMYWTPLPTCSSSSCISSTLQQSRE